MEAHPNSPTRRPKAWRQHITLPGVLAAAVEQRIGELERGTFSNYAIEVVCNDLRIRREHAITGAFAHDPAPIQEAVDRTIVAHYHPGMEPDGGTIRAIIENTLPDRKGARISGASLVKEDRVVRFPWLLTDIIKQRWAELRFTCLSEYVTSVIRYDLLLGGPHRYFHGNDCAPDLLPSLDRETLREFHENRQPRTKADYLVGKAVGRKLTREECDVELRKVGDRLREIAVRRYL